MATGGLDFDGDSAPGGEATQLTFFAPTPAHAVEGEPVENARDRALTRALDQIRSRFGRTAIVPARLVEGPTGTAEGTGPRVEE